MFSHLETKKVLPKKEEKKKKTEIKGFWMDGISRGLGNGKRKNGIDDFSLSTCRYEIIRW